MKREDEKPVSRQESFGDAAEGLVLHNGDQNEQGENDPSPSPLRKVLADADPITSKLDKGSALTRLPRWFARNYLTKPMNYQGLSGAVVREIQKSRDQANKATNGSDSRVVSMKAISRKFGLSMARLEKIHNTSFYSAWILLGFFAIAVINGVIRSDLFVFKLNAGLVAVICLLNFIRHRYRYYQWQLGYTCTFRMFLVDMARHPWRLIPL